MNTPLVSIIIPLFNKESYISQTIESVTTQTYKNMEIIVINDGSTDGSLEVVRKYSIKDKRISILSQRNMGLSGARNRGIASAKGEFVNFLDADDLLYKHFVEETVGYLNANPSKDLVHVSFDWIEEQGDLISSQKAPESDDYLRDLLMGNMFPVHTVLVRRYLIDRIGLFREELRTTEDWDYWLRCAKQGSKFGTLPVVLAATRVLNQSMRKRREDQTYRFFPVIELTFDGTMPLKYERLKDISIIRHHFFLMLDYLRWGWRDEAKKQFETNLRLLSETRITSPEDLSFLTGFATLFSFLQTARFVRVLSTNGARRQAVQILLRRLLPAQLVTKTRTLVKNSLSRTYMFVRRHLGKIDARLTRIHHMSGYRSYDLSQSITLYDIRSRSLDYVTSMRLTRSGEFMGYRYSNSTTKPVLYATLSVLLLKHLYGFHDEHIDEELELVLGFQSDDGLFRDPTIACPQAETCEWWGWRHLTLHALMTLALYDKPARKEICCLELFKDKDRFREYLSSRDWSVNVDNTSNELQNVGVMLQYARDYQNSQNAGALLGILFEVLDAHQDPITGLFGNRFETPRELSLGVQAGYHFWLLYFYDNRPIHEVERIIDNVLKTQNILGGYGAQWNCSACEDIDSIDLLVRLSRLIDYRYNDIQASLQRALPAILHNLNGDGGWVFRRHEPLTMGHPQMFNAPNESNMFYTWFRTLGLAYCLSGLCEVPPYLQYKWNFCRAPGHQFF
jgi:glycosyltransferase involved in cell wall biosynthesis